MDPINILLVIVLVATLVYAFIPPKKDWRPWAIVVSAILVWGLLTAG